MIDSTVKAALEALEVFVELKKKDKKDDSSVELPKTKDIAGDIKDWNSMILSSGIVNTLLFKFSKAKVGIERGKKKPSKEWIVGYFVKLFLEEEMRTPPRFVGRDDYVLGKAPKEIVEDMARLIRSAGRRDIKLFVGSSGEEELLTLFPKLTDVTAGIRITERLQMFLSHLARLFDSLTEEETGSDGGQQE